MQYELYIDVFFVVNFLLDYLVLLVVRRVLKSTAEKKNVLLGAGAGAALTSVLVCLPIAGILKIIILHLVISTVMIKITFGFHRKDILKKWSLLYLVSVLMGGVLSSVSQYLGANFRPIGLFLFVVVCSYRVVERMIEFFEGYCKVSGGKCQVQLYLREKMCVVTAVKDTGNMLYDRITGKPVHIISNNAIKKFTDGIPLTVRYIPYHTVQGDSKVMPLIKIDKMCICGKKKIEVREPLIGISECSEFGSGEYELILHPKDLREE